MQSAIISLFMGFSAPWVPQTALIATEVIRSGDLVSEANSEMDASYTGLIDPGLIGREVRRTVYIGQEIKPENTRSRRLVRRNQMVSVKYLAGNLEILITARALGEASAGETVEVMNTQSRKVITGTVTDQGWIRAR